MSGGARVDAAWLGSPAAVAVCGMLETAGWQALFVGGCVRDALLGREAADLDLATDARPQEVMALARAAGLRAAPTGIEHGTVTLIHAGRPIEVTTFRQDVATDGRRAVVSFADNLSEDARRRDFTMNALYARRDGTVVDPLGGLADLRDRRVRFVGDPALRIAEDYLRVLRFFRFHAWYGDPAAGLDREAMAACAASLDGLGRLSRERVGAEITRLLAARDPAPSVAAMAASGVLAHVLPGADIGTLAPLVHVEAAAGHSPSWRRRLASLGHDPDWRDRLRLSRADGRALDAIAAALVSGDAPAVAAYRHGTEAARDAALIRAATLGELPPDALDSELARGASARMPLRAEDLKGLEGKPLGAALARAEAAWIASDFRLGSAELLAAAVPER